jgi:cobyrinic acid a,c-diamide synthase
MDRLLVSAAHKSSGKTTVSIGLCAALAAQGSTVQAFKKGPDYIDPMWLGEASGRACYNLDPYLMTPGQIRTLFADKAAASDIAIVEGNKGLYDGLALDGSNSNAALAHLLGLPVLLVIDARGMTRGIAPLILGYQAFDRNLHIAGVVLNQLGGSRHEAKLRAVIEHYTDVPVVGAIGHDPALEVTERHLGLMPSNEKSDAERCVRLMGERIAASVDLARVRSIAASAAPWPAHTPAALPATPADRPVRIGVAQDRAFGFYYPDDLQALHEAGAELLPFDTLRDSALPPRLDGLFIGGGFPEVFMAELEANAALREQIAAAIEAGLPVYAECGGLMYLSRSLSWKGRTCRMVGAIAGDTVLHDRPVGRGYVTLDATGDMPWSGWTGHTGVRGHEFHYSSLDNLPAGTRYAWRVRRGHGIDGQHDGIVHRNVLASYTHLRSLGGTDWTRHFVDFVRRHARSTTSPEVQPTAHERVPA